MCGDGEADNDQRNLSLKDRQVGRPEGGGLVEEVVFKLNPAGEKEAGRKLFLHKGEAHKPGSRA